YLDVLCSLEIDRHSGHAGDGTLETLDDLIDVRSSLVAWSEGNRNPAGIRRRVDRADTDDGDDAANIGIRPDRILDATLAALHLGERHIGAGLGDGRDQAGILQGQKTFRRNDIKQDGGCERCERHRERFRLVPQTLAVTLATLAAT